MRKYFERASSTERRFVTATFLILFLALNWIFVWPLFSDWSKYELRRQKALRTLKIFEDTIAQATTLKSKVTALEGEGMAVPPEDQTVKFMTAIQSQAAASGFTIQNSVSQQPRTNQFFLERVQALTLTATESQLVDFLYKLGTGESLVRVRGLSLRPDPPRHSLLANLTLVASYQKKPPVRSATPPPAAAAAAPAPAAKPAPASAAKPAAPAEDKSKSTPPAKSDKPAAAKPAPDKPTPAKPAAPGVPKPSTPTK